MANKITKEYRCGLLAQMMNYPEGSEECEALFRLYLKALNQGSLDALSDQFDAMMPSDPKFQVLGDALHRYIMGPSGE